MKKVDVIDLPQLQREVVVLKELGPVKAKKFNAEITRIESIRESAGSLRADAALMELVRETMRLKAADVCAYVKTVLECSPVKFIVFVHHKELRDKIIESLGSVDHIVVDGSTPMAKRGALFDRFRVTPMCRVAVLSIQACSTGLNLQFVSLILFAELLFSSVVHSQAEARCHRVGQTSSVLCQYLTIKGSTDDMVWRTIKRKANTQATLMMNALDTADTMSTAFSARTVDNKRKRLETEDEDENDDEDEDDEHLMYDSTQILQRAHA